MKFARLLLPRYGCFTNLELPLDAPGVHLIVTPNEGGKSTLLEGVDDLLYGIPRQTGQDHLHHVSELEISAQLVVAGESLELTRTRRGALLRGPRGELGEGGIERLMHGLPRDAYRALFAFDHAEVRDGGQMLLSTKGEVGRVLFAAGHGRVKLAGLVDQLGQRAAELYKPGGSRPKVNAALGRYQDAVRRMRAQELRPADWEATLTELEGIEADLGLRRQREAELRGRQVRHQRLRAAMPNLARRAAAINERNALLGEGCRLTPDQQHLHAALTLEMADARRERERAVHDIARISAAARRIATDEAVLAAAREVERLSALTGAYDGWRVDEPELEARVSAAQTEARRLARQLRPEFPVHELREELTLTVDQHAELEEAAQEGETVEDDVVTARQAVELAELAMAEAVENRQGLPPGRDPRPLLATLRQARSLGDVAAAHEALVCQRDDAAREGDVLLRRLGLSLPLPELDTIRVPAEETINRHRDVLLAAEAEVDRLEAETREAARAVATARAELDTLVQNEELPDADAVGAARAYRDAGWSALRLAWQGGGDDEAARWSGGEDPADAYEHAVVQADDAADAFRYRAEAVARHRSAVDRIRLHEADAARLNTRHRAAISHLEEERRRWAATWDTVDIEPRDPDTMLDWLADHERASHHAREWRIASADLDRLVHATEAAAAEVRAVLIASTPESPPDGACFSDLVELAEAVATEVAAAETARREREHAVTATRRRLDAAQRHLHGARRRQDEWTGRWRNALATAGLTGATSPAAARCWAAAVVEFHCACDVVDAATRAQERLRKRIHEFEEDVTALAFLLDPTLAGQNPLVVVEHFGRRLAAEGEAITRLDGLLGEQGQAEARLAGAEEGLARAAARIDGLCRELDLSGAELLPADVARSARLDALEVAIADCEELLLAQGDGLDVATLAVEAEGVAPEEVEAELALIAGALDDLGPDIEALARRAGELRVTFTQWHGGADAAVAAEEAQESLADALEMAEEFARLRTAQYLLQREIELNRRQNEGPVLDRAGELLTRLTDGRYTQVVAEFDAGEAVLRARRLDGSLVALENLSDGTRDVLWLALRIASVERWAEAYGPLPIILDDVAVGLDDERTGALFEVLGGLAQRFQVLFLTHHEHFVRIAQSVLPGQFHLHHLGRFDPTAWGSSPPPAAGRPGAASSEHLLAAMVGAARPLARSELLEKTGMPPEAWPAAIQALLDAGSVVAEGTGRGRRYGPC